jgi:tungstate transport system permease protein
MEPALVEIVGLSLRVSGTALLFSTLVGIPLGIFLGMKRFVGRRLVIALLYTGMGFPPVVVGLFVYMMLSRNGPLGQLDWAVTMAAVIGVDPNLRQQVRALGATRWQTVAAVLSEARVGVIVSIIAGFGAIISEVGAVMMVGGNIENRTRVLTTAIVLETQKGNFDLAMSLGVVLLIITFVINALVLRLQGRALDE